MKRMVAMAMLALTVPALWVLPAWAGGGDGVAYDTYTLGEIVVTGERPGVAQMALTTTITAEEIKATGSQNVAEAMAHCAGHHGIHRPKGRNRHLHPRLRAEQDPGAHRRGAFL